MRRSLPAVIPGLTGHRVFFTLLPLILLGAVWAIATVEDDGSGTGQFWVTVLVSILAGFLSGVLSSSFLDVWSTEDAESNDACFPASSMEDIKRAVHEAMASDHARRQSERGPLRRWLHR